MRHNLDLLAAHSRELARHSIAFVLLCGTLAGTIWTFSNGTLTLSGVWERIISVGGIAAALEVGGIFTGLYIQQIDLRIQSAKRRETADYYRGYRVQLYIWFALILAISFVANLLFRSQQLGSAGLAAFVSAAPIVLICLFTIVLRPLPVDYAELGRQATQRGLLVLTRNAQSVMMDYMREVGRGRVPSEEKQKAMAISAAFLRTYAQASEQQALDYAMSAGNGENVVEGSAIEMLTSTDVMRLYDVPRRTAQSWIASCPGRKRAQDGKAWLVPAHMIYQAHRLPKPSESHYAASSALVQNGAANTPSVAGMTQLALAEAQ